MLPVFHPVVHSNQSDVLDNYHDLIPAEDISVIFSPTNPESQMFQKIYAAASISLLLIVPVQAQIKEASPFLPVGTPTIQVPGADAMLKFCKNTKPGYQEICDGYLRGIAEFQEFIWSGQMEPIFCLPDDWTESTMRPVVVSYISENLDNWQGRPALGAVIAALTNKFPCP